jgi:serine phosphatase RsbU (regulator of sigma subunit)
MAKFGLRSKSLLALVLACLLALVPASLVGWNIVDGVREHFGRAYANNFTQLNRQKILAPLSRELALSRRMAQSEVTLQWLRDPGNATAAELFFREAEGYRRDFVDHAYFIARQSDGNYYFNDDSKPVSFEPRYTLNATNPTDGWFYGSLRSLDPYNINVSTDRALKITRVWINVVVRDGTTPVALAGASLNLNRFLDEFVRSGEAGVTPMIVNENGAIQAHRDAALIAYNSGATDTGETQRVFGLMSDDASRGALQRAMQTARSDANTVPSEWVTLAGKRQLLSVAYIPELKWYVLTAVDLNAARIIDTGWLWSAGLALILVIMALLLAFGYAVERLVLRPLRRLQQSARAIADGRYDVKLPQGGMDEIGDLSRAFGVMADKVRSHTAELESRVQARTTELAAANREMAVAHKKIGDSIDYASLIQRAILPDRQMTHSLGAHHFVLWQPRDVVGGDFYVFRADGDNCLLGVVDCAGHGVPGALMTMLARAAVDLAIAEAGVRDPAAVLVRVDQAMRAMLEDAQLPRTLATAMDAGLVYVDRSGGKIVFSGAKLSLFASNGVDVEEFTGGRRALGDKRLGDYANQEVALRPDWTFYLATDGFLDQAGGEHGFGFGTSRFASMIKAHARLPLEQQGAAFVQVLAEYQGDLPQRDDITMLSFRFE